MLRVRRWQHFPEALHLALCNCHFVARLRIRAALYIPGKFRKCRDALPLQAGVFRREIAVALGMPGIMARICAKHIFGKKILRIAASVRSHGDHEQRGAF